MRSSVIRKASGKAFIAFLLFVVWMLLPSSVLGSEDEQLSQSQVVRLSLQSAETGIRMPYLVYLPKGHGGGDA